MKSFLSKAADGCHRWGWLINLIITALLMAYYIGGLVNKIETIEGRVSRIERLLDARVIVK